MSNTITLIYHHSSVKIILMSPVILMLRYVASSHLSAWLLSIGSKGLLLNKDNFKAIFFWVIVSRRSRLFSALFEKIIFIIVFVMKIGEKWHLLYHILDQIILFLYAWGEQENLWHLHQTLYLCYLIFFSITKTSWLFVILDEDLMRPLSSEVQQ